MTTEKRKKTNPPADAPPAPAALPEHAALPEDLPLDDPELFLNRDLSWLAFNRRVLAQAMDTRIPLLERVRFLAIAGGNLDEFFMKRIGSLKQQADLRPRKLSPDGRTPQQRIDESSELIREQLALKRELEQELLTLLAKENIRILQYSELDERRRAFLDDYFRENVYPLLTPQGMDPAHPFPFISNLSLNLLVATRLKEGGHVRLSRIKMPAGPGADAPRFIRAEGRRHTYVLFEDIVANNLDMIFPGLEIVSCARFRVTRNAVAERQTDQDADLLATIESTLRERRFAEIVRLEVEPGMDAQHRILLASQLRIDAHRDVFETPGIMAKADLAEIAAIDRPSLRYPAHAPAEHPRISPDAPNIFHLIREEGPFLLQHPYQSFPATVERFLKEAGQDPKVLGIKMTLYRTSADARMIEHLLEAAGNGKQVAVAVELTARFDESANIRWATHLEQAGVHVTYGVVGLKTHAKVIFVVRRDHDGLTRYAHIGTGNYNAVTARIYSDLGLLTRDPALTGDLTEFFNFLTLGCAPQRRYARLLPSPHFLKKALLEKIEREIAHQAAGHGGHIRCKTNALTDEDIIRALYRASRAGVRVDLIVRDSCLLRPGLPGLSENIRVISIVGRFLEHSRIYHFRNNGEEEYFIGSADLMERNLDRRVELLAPVDAPALKERLGEILDRQLADQRDAWDMQPDGSYVQRHPKKGDRDKRSAQEWLIERARQAAAETRPGRRRKETEAGPE